LYRENLKVLASRDVTLVPENQERLCPITASVFERWSSGSLSMLETVAHIPN
jgi:hypothetical protein